MNSSKLIASGDMIANCLYNKWNKAVMTSFESLSSNEIDQIYKYIESESRNKNIPRDLVKYIDSCQISVDTTYMFSGGMLIDSIITRSSTNGNDQEIISLSSSYEFNIIDFGWYNVDLFLNTNNAKIDNFQFEIKDEKERNGNIYGFAVFKNRDVIIPLEKKNLKYFLKYGNSKDKIEFPLNEKMEIIVLEEFKDKIIGIGNIEISSKLTNNSYIIQVKDIRDEDISDYVNKILR